MIDSAIAADRVCGLSLSRQIFTVARLN